MKEPTSLLHWYYLTTLFVLWLGRNLVSSFPLPADIALPRREAPGLEMLKQFSTPP
jgi:hypothetical protein